MAIDYMGLPDTGRMSSFLDAGTLIKEIGIKKVTLIPATKASGFYLPCNKTIEVLGNFDLSMKYIWFHELVHAVEDSMYKQCSHGESETIACRVGLWMARIYGFGPKVSSRAIGYANLYGGFVRPDRFEEERVKERCFYIKRKIAPHLGKKANTNVVVY